jgi:predicted regulator of Ras-like GTPase activity (Roadblock/LC7/MglB family)
MSPQHELDRILQALCQALPEATGAVVASSEGLVVASYPEGLEPTRVAVMAAMAHELGQRVAATLAQGAFHEATVCGERGCVSLYSTEGNVILAVQTSAGVNLGLVHLEARSAAYRIRRALRPSLPGASSSGGGP